VNSKDDLVRIFQNNVYGSFTVILNSTKNKRGVAILINNNLPFSEEETVRDVDENIVLSRLRINGKSFIIGSVYGPNKHDQNFFNTLGNLITGLGNHPVIVGGDWNLTPSNLPVDLNPDCCDMGSLPNHRHTEYFNTLCTNLNLVEIYRFLHPTTNDFSYITRAEAASNKSRIDFFVVSDLLVDKIKDCNIEDTVQSKMFDHKAVNLIFLGSEARPHKSGFSNKIINDPIVKLLLQAITFDCYLIYQDRVPDERDELKRQIGDLLAGIRSLVPCANFYRLPVDLVQNNRDDILQGINMTLDNPRIRSIPEHEINVDADLFFEMLCNHIRNALTSYDSYVNKFIRKSKLDLRVELQQLKSAQDLDRNRIRLIKNSLQGISEREIELKLETHPVFEHINGEKMSPMFLRLAKVRDSNDNLSVIKNTNGVPFETAAERNQHIVTTFADVYKRPQNYPVNFENLIENFLGEEICNHPLVQASKLTVEEAALLDRPLSLQELDKAVRECKSRTAPGIDGFSNEFIKKHWQIFRYPLLEYAHACFRKGALTDSFSTGTIRLIPKKGNLSQIKNWRPITLLNCSIK
jgi:exonuclease III